MRTVIIAAGTWGDVRPNVVLAQALQTAGYEVVLVAAEEFRVWVEGRGLPFAGLSFNIQAVLDALTNSNNLLQAMKWMRSVAPTMLQMGREIADVVRPGDAVLMNETGLALANGVVEKNNARLVHVNMQPFAPTAEFSGMLPAPPAWIPIQEAAYNRWAGNFVRRSQWWTMGARGNQLRANFLGLPKQTWAKHRAMLEAAPALLLISPHVLARPTDWRPHYRITGYLFDDDATWQAPPDLLDFLTDGEKPVYIGFGSMRQRKPEATTRLILDAVKRTGKRAVVLKGWAGMGASDLPKDVFLLKYAPHSWLFPRMAAVVHHGGAGTTAAGLRAGVPSVVIPVLADQPFWGRRVHELGVGTKPIPQSKLTAENLAAALDEATTNRAMQEKAAELGMKITAEDGIGEVLKAIQEFLA